MSNLKWTENMRKLALRSVRENNLLRALGQSTAAFMEARNCRPSKHRDAVLTACYLTVEYVCMEIKEHGDHSAKSESGRIQSYLKFLGV